MSKEKRDHILNTAMHLFNEFGFHAMPTSRIAKESKVSVGTLFNYFPTKEDLIVEIYTEIKSRSKASFISHLPELVSENPLRKMWHLVVDWGLENPDEFHYTILFQHSPFKKMFKSEKTMESYNKIRETVKELPSKNNICKVYPEFSMIYMNNSIVATTNFLMENDVEDKEHFINSAFDLFWTGFSPE